MQLLPYQFLELYLAQEYYPYHPAAVLWSSYEYSRWFVKNVNILHDLPNNLMSTFTEKIIKRC